MLLLPILLALLAPGATVPAGGATPFRGDIHQLTVQSADFRRVLYTGPHVQVVAMSLLPDENIGAEVHGVDQCFFFVTGRGRATVAGEDFDVSADSVVCVPGGTRHDFRNTGAGPLKLFTIYAPPQHPAGTVHHRKADAQKAEKH